MAGEAHAGGQSTGTQLGFGGRLKRIGLVVLMTLLTLNVWTGSPLAALWVGSRVQGSGPASMAAIAVVAATMAALSLVLLRLLNLVGAAYDRLTNRKPTVRQHVPWLRSLRGERPHEEASHRTLSALDVVVVTMVVIAVVAFEIWFFFFSSSPIDQRSGR